MQYLYKSIFAKGFMAAIICLPLLCATQRGYAQLSPSGSAYFLNQFALNPAASGLDENLKVTLSYQQQAGSISPASVTQYLTADYGLSDRVGLGLAVFRQELGLLKGTRFLVNYSYHLPLADNQNLAFGLSLGGFDESINKEGLIGDQGDPVLMQFDDTGIQFDSDFGLSYTIDNFNVQVVGSSLGSLIYDNRENMITSIRQPSVFVAAGYDILLKPGTNAINLKPKAVFRKVREHEEIVDIGAQINFLDEKLNFFTMYHTSRCATFGLTGEIKDLITFGTMYSTQSTEYSGNVGGNLEFVLQINLD